MNMRRMYKSLAYGFRGMQTAFLAGVCAIGANADDKSYTPDGSAPYYWTDAGSWTGGTLPGSGDMVTLSASDLLLNPLYIGSGTSVNVATCYIDNAVLYVESGAELTVTHSPGLSITRSAGATGVVTNYGTISVQRLDMGCESGAKANFARIDNFGTINIAEKFFMGFRGTSSLFYNHEGATFNKTGGGDYTFYMSASAGGDSTIINEGTMVCGSSTRTWSGNNPNTKNEIIMRKSGTFNPGRRYKIGHGASSVTTINLYDRSSLSGATEYWVGGKSSCKGYITLSNESTFATSRGVHLGYAEKTLGVMSFAGTSSGTFGAECNIGGGTSATGVVELADSATATFNAICRIGTACFGTVGLAGSSLATFNGVCAIGASTGSTGELRMSDSARAVANNEFNICSGQGVTGLVSMAGSSVISNMSKAFVIGRFMNSFGKMEMKDTSRLVCPTTMYLGHGEDGNSTGVRGELVMRDDSEVEMTGEYLRLGTKPGATGVIDMRGFSVLAAENEFGVGRHTSSTGLVTVAENARLDCGSIYLADYSSAFARMTVSDSAVVSCPVMTVGSGDGAVAELKLSGGSLLSVSNLWVAYNASASTGTVEIADNAVVSNDYINIGRESETSLGVLWMRGGSIIQSGLIVDSFVLNASRTRPGAWIRGWGKIAFADPREQITDWEDISGRSRPNGLVHYGQIIADGEGEERDLDFSRFGAFSRKNTAANECGTNGWFAVNKGRLKLPRCLPRKTAEYKCTGDCYDLDYADGSDVNSTRLANTFTCTFAGAGLDNYVFSELYATDRSDIPAGLASVTGSGSPVSVWRIGLFSDGPEVDEPTSPSAFTSADLRFRLPTDAVEGVYSVCVYHHDGTADGKWRRVGYAGTDMDRTVAPASLTASGSGNWNMGWFAIAVRTAPVGLTVSIF